MKLHDDKEVCVSGVRGRLILEPLNDSDSMPWATIDTLEDEPFMPEGREQPSMPEDRVVFD